LYGWVVSGQKDAEKIRSDRVHPPAFTTPTLWPHPISNGDTGLDKKK